MQFKRQITNHLHGEQFAPIFWLESLEEVVSSAAFECVPTPRMALKTIKTLNGLRDALEQRLLRSLMFEELHLLPLLAETNQYPAGAAFLRKRRQLLNQTEEALALAAHLCDELPTPQAWDELVECCEKLTHTLLHYLQISEMELMPSLDFMLKDERDRQLLQQYQRRETPLHQVSSAWSGGQLLAGQPMTLM